MVEAFLAFRQPDPTDAVKPVVIVGGGLSGLAAGVALVSRHIPVLILEQKPYPGGRAYSFSDLATGDIVDNGQHVLIAGYDRTMQFLDTIGSRHHLRVQPRPSLVFHHPERGFRTFRLPKLPSPLHLLIGVLSSNLLPVADRVRMLRAGLDIRNCTPHHERSIEGSTIDQWLNSVGQSDESKRSFWEPLAVSIMNEHISSASALLFVRSLRKAFFAGWKGAAMAIPSVGLSSLYVDAAVEYIRARGGDVRCSADVVRVMLHEGTATALQLRDGSVIETTACLLTVPPNKLRPLLPEPLPEHLSPMLEVPPSPIVSIHFWFAGEFMQHAMVGLIGKRIQWIFDKRRLNAHPGAGPHVSAVISAAHDYVTCSNETLTKIALEDLRAVYGSQVGEPLHTVVIREKRATFSATPPTELVRPGPETGVRNLFLCGDWTSTGYPATIEGAVISGERSAAAVCALLEATGNTLNVAFHKSIDHIVHNMERPL